MKWKRWRRFSLFGAGCILLAWAVFHFVVPFWIGLPAGLLEELQASPSFHDREGRQLRRLLEDEGRSAGVVEYRELPLSFVHATVSAEDKRFFRHGGIDYLALMRAGRDLIVKRRVVSGASTITQQLIKISRGAETDRSLGRKLYEMLAARKLEMQWGKQRILAAYLNRLDYGNLHRGCRAAARGYFGKPVGDLSLAEAAFLSGLPQSPARLNPYKDFEAARKRQHEVLRRVGKVYPALQGDVRRALEEELTLLPRRSAFEAPHFVDHLLSMDDGEEFAYPVRTTLNLPLQGYCETLLMRHLESLGDRNVTNGAIVILENETGDVLAMVGSVDYMDPDGGQVNGAMAPRSPGSALKPFTYLLALEEGYTPASIVGDIPTEYMTPTGIYRPVNYHRRYAGPVSLRAALGNSLNVPAVRVLQALGGAPVLLDKLRELGITSLEESDDHYGLGLTIGNAPVCLVELVNAYACLARLGGWRPWRCLADARSAPGRRVFREAHAYLLADVLSDPSARLQGFGLNTPLNLPFRVACKTGTSSSFRDTWAIGYTPAHTVGVWIGNFDGSAMHHVSSATGAGPVMRDLFLELYRETEAPWFQRPERITEAVVDSRTGKILADTLAYRHRAFARKERFVSGQLPSLAATTDYDDRGQAYLEEPFRDWFESPDRTDWNRYALRPAGDSRSMMGLSIAFPQPGTVVYLDERLPNQGALLTLHASGRDSVSWSSPTLETREEAGRVQAILEVGRHELTVVDRDTGEEAKTWLEVRRL